MFLKSLPRWTAGLAARFQPVADVPAFQQSVDEVANEEARIKQLIDRDEGNILMFPFGTTGHGSVLIDDAASLSIDEMLSMPVKEFTTRDRYGRSANTMSLLALRENSSDIGLVLTIDGMIARQRKGDNILLPALRSYLHLLNILKVRIDTGDHDVFNHHEMTIGGESIKFALAESRPLSSSVTVTLSSRDTVRVRNVSALLVLLKEVLATEIRICTILISRFTTGTWGAS